MPLDPTLQFLIGQLGMAGIFIYLYFQLRKEFQEERKRYAETLEEKAKENGKVSEKLVNLVENNTAAMTELKASVDANTKSSDRLVTNLDYILRNNKPTNGIN